MCWCGARSAVALYAVVDQVSDVYIEEKDVGMIIIFFIMDIVCHINRPKTSSSWRHAWFEDFTVPSSKYLKGTVNIFSKLNRYSLYFYTHFFVFT